MNLRLTLEGVNLYVEIDFMDLLELFLPLKVTSFWFTIEWVWRDCPKPRKTIIQTQMSDNPKGSELTHL